MSATDATIPKKNFGSGVTALMILNEEMGIMKTIKSPKESSLLIKDVTETIENEAKEQKRWIFWHVIRCIRGSFIRKSINR